MNLNKMAGLGFSVAILLTGESSAYSLGPTELEVQRGRGYKCYSFATVKQCQHAQHELGGRCGTPVSHGRYGGNPEGFWDGAEQPLFEYRRRLSREFNANAQSC